MRIDGHKLCEIMLKELFATLNHSTNTRHFRQEESSPTDSEKAAQVKSTLEKQVTRVTHAAVMEELLSEVEESSVYRPQRAELQDSSSFSEHLRKLMADYEVRSRDKVCLTLITALVDRPTIR